MNRQQENESMKIGLEGDRDRGGGGRGWRELVTRLLVIGESNHGLLVGYQLDDNGKC